LVEAEDEADVGIRREEVDAFREECFEIGFTGIGEGF
jgi:hypothetical protein